MNEFDKAINSISDKLFLYPYQEELLKMLQEKEQDNWLKEQLRLNEQLYSSVSVEVLNPKPLSIDTQIYNIKHQLKYEKNPLIIKNLNRKMNKLIKEKNNERLSKEII